MRIGGRLRGRREAPEDGAYRRRCIHAGGTGRLEMAVVDATPGSPLPNRFPRGDT